MTRLSSQEIFERVRDHMGWSDLKAKLWFSTENPLCGGMTPEEFLLRRPEKAEKWILALIEENKDGRLP